ncbi:MAG: hypothetical protein JRI25_09565 [Deltaproteobacteria bacterium]|nr:hypothetical protein [Deltaproteobacteria bacterium]
MLPENLADLDEIGEQQVVGWLYAEARRMQNRAETAHEAIVWSRSLIERFDATVTIDPTGRPRLELGAPVRAAA